MNARRALARLLLPTFAALTLAAGARAQDPDVPPPVGFVNDRANVMDEPSRAKLEGFLDQVQKKTGAQFAVLTVTSTAPLTADEYKVKVFEAWGIGSRERRDGLLLLVSIQEREAKFETGYGLEGTLPDGWQSRMFRAEMAPRFREGDFAGGISAGMVACAGRLAAEQGVTLEWDGRELRYRETRSRRGIPPAIVIFILVVFVLMMVAASRGSSHRRRQRRNFWDGFGGGWGGGFGGGLGGGFGGGGFGGGGGGGSSFGGFGGGSSGGGGGGGKW